MSERHQLVLAWREGRRESVRASGDETVLTAAESANVGLPFGCRTGACGSCVGRLLDGDVTYDRPPRALNARQREAGYVLCCLAQPLTHCRFEVGVAVLTDLVATPFR